MLVPAGVASAHQGTTADCDTYDVQANDGHTHLCLNVNGISRLVEVDHTPSLMQTDHQGTTADCDTYDVQANDGHTHVCIDSDGIITRIGELISDRVVASI